MINPSLYTALAAALLFVSCNDSKLESNNSAQLRDGNWELNFDIGDGVEIPVRLEIDSLGKWSLRNWTEIIPLDSVVWNADSFHVTMPLFNTALHGKMEGDSLMSGKWFDYTREGNYFVPFYGHAVNAHRGDEQFEKRGWQKKFDVTFSPDSIDNAYKAIGVFNTSDSQLTGTFLTEIGDYRYLQGIIKSASESPEVDSLLLSCFDGTHLFLFAGRYDHAQGTINDGMFYSGNHHREPWTGVENENATLRDPDSLTYVKPEFVDFGFHVKNMKGDSVHFDKKQFDGKVCLVQILGTWCPNCTDESLWLKSLYEKHHAHGLEIIPVAFERGDNDQALIQNIQRQFTQMKIPYAPYLGGEKAKVEEVFPMLNRMMSYPTLIFIDKKGAVRKIHTGFYGQGTGSYYNMFSERLEMFVEELLGE